MKKHKLKKIIIAAIVCVFAVLGIMKFSIEPADYKKCVVKDLKTATQLVQNARAGNENGQYSENVILSFRNSIKDAQKLVDDKSSTVDEEKSAYQSLKASINTFKSSKNKDSISKDTVTELKNGGKVLDKKIQLDKNTALTWGINGKAIDKPVTINPDVSYNTAYKEAIQKILQTNQMKGTILSFRHNGGLPGFASISVDCKGGASDLYLYRYDSDSNQLVYSVKVNVEQQKEIFAVDRGGDWVIADKQLATVNSVPVSAATSSTTSQSGASSSASSGASSGKSGGKSGSASAAVGSTAGGLAGGTGGAAAAGNTDGTGGGGSGGSSGPTCTLEIRCDTILNNMANLKSGLAPYVPSDGTILAKTQISFTNGENVFDILKRVTRNDKIQMEFRNDPTYSGAYVEGIHNLYEFDCGSQSGWEYMVNGWFPSYGCSQYKVKNGDAILWAYTCDCGKDVGDQYWKTH